MIHSLRKPHQNPISLKKPLFNMDFGAHVQKRWPMQKAVKAKPFIYIQHLTAFRHYLFQTWANPSPDDLVLVENMTSCLYCCLH